ncbi:WD40 repeat domain-containing protein, partial [Okeania sp. SIO2G5]|uniref:WD40 repeat domain-containing protein n=1 Tax=Okeania sp. SIO2G5 TaxID=2607796 RepID=UPI0013C19800
RPPENIKKIQLSPELHYVMVHSETDVSIWNIETQESTRLPIDKAGSVTISDVSFSDDGRYMAMNMESEGRLWDVVNKEFVRLPVDDITYLRVSPNGQFVAIETNEGIKVWDLEGQKQKDLLPGKKLSRERSTFSPNSRYLRLNDQPDQLRLALMLRDIENQTAVELPVEDIESIESLYFSRDDHYVSFATDLGRYVLWDMQQQMEVKLPEKELESIDSLSFSPDGNYVYIRSQGDESETLWDLKKQETVDLPIGNVEQILFEASGHDGHRYVILKNQSETVLWDLENKERDNWTEGKFSINPTSQFKVSPDGQSLALQNEGVIVTWDIDKKIEIARITSDRRFGQQGFGFSPGGDFLISHNQNFLHIMLLNPDTLIEKACDRLPRNLTKQKWEQYFRDELTGKAERYEKTCEQLAEPDDLH